jgi:hypothetical protein
MTLFLKGRSKAEGKSRTNQAFDLDALLCRKSGKEFLL